MSREKQRGAFPMADIDVLAITISVLRVICMLALATSITILTMDDWFINTRGTMKTFKGIVPYRYILCSAVIWVAHSLIRHEFFQELDFFGDKALSFLLASVGFAYSFKLEGVLKRLLAVIRSFEAIIPESDKQRILNKLDAAIFAIELLAVGFACMAIVSFYVSIARSSGRRFWR